MRFLVALAIIVTAPLSILLVAMLVHPLLGVGLFIAWAIYMMLLWRGYKEAEKELEL